MNKKTVKDIDVKGKVVFCRVDFNVKVNAAEYDFAFYVDVFYCFFIHALGDPPSKWFA